MKKYNKVVILAVIMLSLLSGCSKEDLKIYDVQIFRGAPAWDLAKAVNDQDTKKIAQIAKIKPETLNYQDHKYGATPLFWAIGLLSMMRRKRC